MIIVAVDLIIQNDRNYGDFSIGPIDKNGRGRGSDGHDYQRGRDGDYYDMGPSRSSRSRNNNDRSTICKSSSLSITSNTSLYEKQKRDNLNAIKSVESSNNYKAQNSHSTASRAY